MVLKIEVKSSTVVDTEKTTVVSLSKETCVKLIQDLAENLGKIGTGRLVLKTSDDRYLIFKVEDV